MRGFGEIAERLRRSTVQVRFNGRGGGGSGIVWKPDGLILTNAHVARGPQAEIELWDGRRLPAKLVSKDARRDLATFRRPCSACNCRHFGHEPPWERAT